VCFSRPFCPTRCAARTSIFRGGCQPLKLRRSPRPASARLCSAPSRHAGSRTCSVTSLSLFHRPHRRRALWQPIATVPMPPSMICGLISPRAAFSADHPLDHLRRGLHLRLDSCCSLISLARHSSLHRFQLCASPLRWRYRLRSEKPRRRAADPRNQHSSIFLPLHVMQYVATQRAARQRSASCPAHATSCRAYRRRTARPSGGPVRRQVSPRPRIPATSLTCRARARVYGMLRSCRTPLSQHALQPDASLE